MHLSDLPRVLLAGCWLAALPLAAKTTPPAPNPDSAATRDAIAALAKGPIHDLGDSLAQVNARLDLLANDLKRLNDGWQGMHWPVMVQQAADNAAGLAALSDRHAALDARMGADEQRSAQSTLDGLAAIKSLDLRIDADEKRAEGAEGTVRTLSSALPRDVSQSLATAAAAEKETAAASERRLVRVAAAATAALGLLMAAVACWEARRRLALQSEVLVALARLGTEWRQSIAAATAALRVAPAGAEGGAPPDWAEMECRLRRLADRWESVTPAPLAAPFLTPVTGYGTAVGDLSPSEKPTVSVDLRGEPSVASRLLWPEDFLDPQSPLSRWRFLLESHFETAEHPALPVLADLMALRAAVGRTVANAGDIAAATFHLSESLHAYWLSLPDLSSDDRQQASAAWLRSVRQLVGAAAPRLELREVLPGARVDPDLMYAAKDGPGNRLTVAEVYSWAVIDRSADRPRILHRAQVATA